ncbi:RWD domain-containing protein 4-like [Ptychodera flava]|uniref:RWD domain-containing protein 4-like n=1 Tax=Ptychodera flava TaxID=63121 RepID=UPI003969EB09
MSCEEQQEEEREVLASIYEGDECYKQVNETTFQYKIGESGHYKSFLVEVKWTENYPESLPNINLDAFYNNHVSPDVKSHVVSQLNEQAEQFLDSAMTYTIFEWAKENAEDLMVDQKEQIVAQKIEETNGESNQQTAKKKEKKEQLSKAQKRKLANRTDHKGERPRGWDWVDVVKLSKTGNKD